MEPVLYIIMRNDLPSLNPGKLAAQASHVTSVFTANVDKKSKLYTEWSSQTEYNYGTVICLESSYENLNYIGRKFTNKNFGYVYDPTYPCKVDKEIGEYFLNNAYVNEGMFFFEKELNSENLTEYYLLRNELVGAYYFCDRSNESDQLYQFIKNNFKLYK